jgi:small subunit ribosomal protein S21
MTQVFVKNNDINKAIKILKRKLKNENIPNELRKREFYISKSEQRRLDKKRGIRKALKAQQKNNEG